MRNRRGVVMTISKTRLEAFSDGVITIMVLERKTPAHAAHIGDLGLDAGAAELRAELRLCRDLPRSTRLLGVV